MEPLEHAGVNCDVADRYWKPQRQAALSALLEGNNQVQTASIVGVDTRTIRRYQQEPQFVKKLRQGRDLIRETQRNRAVAMHNTALDVLEDLLDSDADQVRLNAAKTVLRLSEAVDLDDLSARIDEMEDHYLGNGHDSDPPVLMPHDAR